MNPNMTKLRKALNFVRTKANEHALELEKRQSDITVQQLVILLYIAENPDVSIGQIVKDLDMAQSSVSRNVAVLGKFHRLGKPGLHWVEEHMDPKERRRKLQRLTPAGKKIVDKLMKGVA